MKNRLNSLTMAQKPSKILTAHVCMPFWKSVCVCMPP